MSSRAEFLKKAVSMKIGPVSASSDYQMNIEGNSETDQVSAENHINRNPTRDVEVSSGSNVLSADNTPIYSSNTGEEKHTKSNGSNNASNSGTSGNRTLNLAPLRSIASSNFSPNNDPRAGVEMSHYNEFDQQYSQHDPEPTNTYQPEYPIDSPHNYTAVPALDDQRAYFDRPSNGAPVDTRVYQPQMETPQSLAQNSHYNGGPQHHQQQQQQSPRFTPFFPNTSTESLYSQQQQSQPTGGGPRTPSQQNLFVKPRAAQAQQIVRGESGYAAVRSRQMPSAYNMNQTPQPQPQPQPANDINVDLHSLSMYGGSQTDAPPGAGSNSAAQNKYMLEQQRQYEMYHQQHLLRQQQQHGQQQGQSQYNLASTMQSKKSLGNMRLRPGETPYMLPPEYPQPQGSYYQQQQGQGQGQQMSAATQAQLFGNSNQNAPQPQFSKPRSPIAQQPQRQQQQAYDPYNPQLAQYPSFTSSQSDYQQNTIEVTRTNSYHDRKLPPIPPDAHDSSEAKASSDYQDAFPQTRAPPKRPAELRVTIADNDDNNNGDEGKGDDGETKVVDRRSTLTKQESVSARTPRALALAAIKAKNAALSMQQKGSGDIHSDDGSIASQVDLEMQRRSVNMNEEKEGDRATPDNDEDAGGDDGAEPQTPVYNPLGTRKRKKPIDKTLHPLERHSQNLTGLGTAVKLNKTKQYTDKYDYVIVFPYENHTQTAEARYVIHTMLHAGLEIFPYLSIQEDELIVLFRAPIPVLQAIAEKSQFKMHLDPAVLEQTLLRGNEACRIAPVRIRDDQSITPISPYEHIYLPYQLENDMALYASEKGRTPFTRAIRLKLLHFLVTAPKRFGGCDINLTSMLHKGSVLAMFPLHDVRKCNELLEICIDPYVMPWQFPFTQLKDYFGEKIALYYVFLGHYSFWMLIPIAVGVAFSFMVWYTDDYSHPVLAFFSVCCTTWSIFMLEFWKRTENRTAMDWGMLDYVSRESDRPEFKGKPHAYSHIDGKEMLYFPPKDYRNKIIFSLSVVALFIFLVLGVISSIYVLRWNLEPIIGMYASAVSSLMNVLQITVFNLIYQTVAEKLNKQENHRTDTQYEDALIVKVFSFQFINSYASCFFLAFVAQYLPGQTSSAEGNRGECGYKNCMRPLAMNTGIIFASRIVGKTLLDLLVPYAFCIQKVWQETSGIDEDKELTPAELDYMLMDYDSTIESIRIYADTAVQYGFTMLFVTALPVAYLLGFINNYMKVKFQSWKILTLYQRPTPTGTENIKSWQNIFNIISIVSVATNAGIVCFTMDLLQDYSLFWRMWIFIGYQWMLLSVMYILAILIDDEPEEVRIQRARMECIHEKIIDKYEDDDYDDIMMFEQEEAAANEEGKDGSTKALLRKTSESSIFDYAKTAASRQGADKKAPEKEKGWFERVFSPVEIFTSITTLASNKNRKRGKYQQHESLPNIPLCDYPKSDAVRRQWPRPMNKQTVRGLVHQNSD